MKRKKAKIYIDWNDNDVILSDPEVIEVVILVMKELIKPFNTLQFLGHMMVIKSSAQKFQTPATVVSLTLLTDRKGRQTQTE